jgi:hypothetical protein
MDELGSALRHSDEPNFSVAPFLYMPEGNLASAVRLSFYLSSCDFTDLLQILLLSFCRQISHFIFTRFSKFDYVLKYVKLQVTCSNS